MNKKYRLLVSGIAALSGWVWVAGCAIGQKTDYRQQLPTAKPSPEACFCKGNLDRGYASIRCQPVDTTVEAGGGKEAKFRVGAIGTDRRYQWFFLGADDRPIPVGAGTTGGDTAQLTIKPVTAAKSGYYFCEITTKAPWGGLVRTRTRDAHLTVIADENVGGNQPGASGDLQSFPGQQAIMGAVAQGTACNEPHCKYLSFDHGGPGFNPDATMNKGRVKVKTNGVYVASSQFNVIWYDDYGGTGCGNDNPLGGNRKQFDINDFKTYWFTVYFQSPCATNGTPVIFELEFVKVP